MTHWFKANEFYHLAVQELAEWEVNALPYDRATVAKVSTLVQREALRDAPESSRNPV